MDTKISIGFVIAMALLIIVVLLCLIVAVIAFLAEEKGVMFPVIGIAVVWALVTAGLCWPWEMQYHQWQKTSGVVYQSVGRLISGGDSSGPTEQFVVRFRDGRVRRCDDSRCAGLTPGLTLSLWCMRDWQWASTPGWKCRYAGVDK